MQVQGAGTEATAAEVTRNESVNSLRFSGRGRGWRGGGLGQRRLVFCRMHAAHLAASVLWDVGAPQAPTPRWEKDAEWTSRLQRQVIGDKAGAGAESGACFSQQLGPLSSDIDNTVPLAAAPRITGPGQREKGPDPECQRIWWKAWRPGGRALQFLEGPTPDLAWPLVPLKRQAVRESPTHSALLLTAGSSGIPEGSAHLPKMAVSWAQS